MVHNPTPPYTTKTETKKIILQEPVEQNVESLEKNELVSQGDKLTHNTCPGY